jgi:two-component system, cell cycle sensor histidine kinase and response regulator CckA
MHEAAGSPLPPLPPAGSHEDPPRGDVTSRQDTASQARDQQADAATIARLHALVETTSDWIWEVDAQGVYTYASPKVMDLLGYTPDEVLGKRPFDFMPEEEARRIGALLEPRWKAAAPFSHIENVNRHRDGRFVMLETSAVPFFGDDGRLAGYRGVDRDITERKRAEEERRQREEKFRAVIETTAEWIWMIDTQGRHTFSNPAVRTILGYAPEDIVGRQALDLVHEDDRTAVRALIAARIIRREGWSGLVLRWRHKDGTFRHLESTAVPIFDRDGVVVGFQGADRDITERLQAERERDRLWSLSVDMLCIAGFDGTLKQINPAWTTTLGWSSEELTTRAWLDFVHPDDRAATIAAGSRLVQGERLLGFENRYQCHDGSWRWLSWNSFPLPEQKLMFGVVRDVTERKRAEEAASGRQAMLASIFRVAPSGIGVVTNRRLLEVNDRVCEMTGYSRDELIGQSSRLLYPSQEEFEFVGREKYRQISEQGTGTVETRWQRKDGTIIHILLSSTPIDAGNLASGVTFTATDITERKRMEASLRESEERYRQLFDLESDAIVVVDDETDGILEANRAVEKLYGYTRDEWLKLKSIDVSTEPEKSRRLVAERPPTIPVRWHRKKDGTVFPVEMTLSFFEMRGRPVHMVAIRDITDRVRAEEERRRLEAQVQQAQKLESLGVLAGGIAHDFNNLLTAILGYANLALADLAPESPACEHLREIEKASCRAADLCRQMLAYAGRSRLVVEPVNLSRLVHELAHLLHVSISKKVVLRCHLADDLPAIEADPVQMRQVAMNLVINASEAIGDADGVIRLATGTMECDEACLRACDLAEPPPAGRFVYLEVEDSGCGMDAETRAKIFDPFFTTKFAGRGLGLAAVLGIVRKHGGTLRVQSEPGRGTMFRILIPATNRKAPASAAAGRVETWRGQGTILIVDDEEPVRKVAARMLERAGFTVKPAGDGIEALEVFEHHRREIVCVLLDLAMPRMDGEQALRKLREIDVNVPVIIASGYSDHEVSQRFAGEEVAGFVQKPYHMSTLIAKLRETLGGTDATLG